MDQQELVSVIDRAAADGSDELRLAKKGVTALPAAIGRLTKLKKLDLTQNEITVLPPEIGNLTNLTTLLLARNRLKALPPEIGRLRKLKRLNVGFNLLAGLPAEIGELTELSTSLIIDHNPLAALPPEIGRLTKLLELKAFNNHSMRLPPEFWNLISLKRLYLMTTHLPCLPPEIGRLTKLEELFFHGSHPAELTPEIGKLANLKTLVLRGVKSLPPEIGRLGKLRDLILFQNQLTALPAEIGHLSELTYLNVSGGLLRTLPPDIGRLSKLKRLDLVGNMLTSLPAELKDLTELETLCQLSRQWGSSPSHEVIDVMAARAAEAGEQGLRENPLKSPPPEIAAQGAEAVRAYLRAQAEGTQRQWAAKLVVVGEGGVGKTSLLRGLQGEPFRRGEPPTHGMTGRTLVLPHPDQALPGVRLELNAWDFGGQEVYHATHHFFLTDGALFVLVWNARTGDQQGWLTYWLETIRARAPHSPILLVATHADEREADPPFAELRRSYPQLVGHWSVSNATGAGVDEFRNRLRTAAAGLPAMGVSLPSTWLEAARVAVGRPETHLPVGHMHALLEQHAVRADERQVLLRWLSERGAIIYFHDQPGLNDVVWLKPGWVSQVVGLILDSKQVRQAEGVLTRQCVRDLWQGIDPATQEHLLRLMERFDLCYPTDQDRQVYLVVEHLPQNPPGFQDRWEAAGKGQACREMCRTYHLNTLPAGIPSWFIAREHRFSTDLHWRRGALLEDSDKKHLALLEAWPDQNRLRLCVRGPYPQEFFAVLKDGLELTLRRYPALSVRRSIPCLGHGDAPCAGEFDEERLRTFRNRTPPKLTAECPESGEMVSVTMLLHGWEEDPDASPATPSTREELRSLGRKILREIAAVDCPSLFLLRPVAPQERLSGFLRRAWDWVVGWLPSRLTGAQGVQGLFVQKMELILCCECRGKEHLLTRGGRYVFDRLADWLTELAPLAPYLQTACKILKRTVPHAGPMGDAATEAIEYMQEIVKQLESLSESPTLLETGYQEAEGAAKRVLRILLKSLDKHENWGGLRRVDTPELHTCWVCSEHESQAREGG